MNQPEVRRSSTFNVWVSRWLFIGLILIAGQILIGGITRLTGSGLSITKWEIVTGTLPPMSDEAWDQAFALYQDTPQYRLINKGMSLYDFKYIYFWEYFHRLWARLMGLLFAIPFLVFVAKGWISRWLVIKLLVLVGLAALTASFGWIMVASGLIERPWVNAYKLGIHLLLGFSVFLWCYHCWYVYRQRLGSLDTLPVIANRVSAWLFALVVAQVFLGGLVSGMKAGFAFPTWPSYHGSWIPVILLESSHWNWSAFVNYDDTEFMFALVQFLHRNVGYLIGLVGLLMGIRLLLRNHAPSKFSVWPALLILVVLAQLSLGVLTVLGFKEGMPIQLASLHQMVGLLLLTLIFHGWFHQHGKQIIILEDH